MQCSVKCVKNIALESQIIVFLDFMSKTVNCQCDITDGIKAQVYPDGQFNQIYLNLE